LGESSLSDRAKDRAGAAERKSREKILKLIEEGDRERLEEELSKIKDPTLGKEFLPGAPTDMN
jgi:hypothetical protein